jgi:hypothetical protein
MEIKNMSIIKKIAIVGFVLAGGVASGFLAPDHVVVTRTATTDASPQAVMALAASTQGYQTFNPYKDSDPALKITPFGPASGVGSGFAFDGKDGKGTTTITSHTANRVDYQIKLDGMGAPTQAIQTKVTPEGTHIEWSLRMEFGNNPALRLMGLMMPAMMGPTLEQGVGNLKKVTSEA